jgi:hypothetical protein
MTLQVRFASALQTMRILWVGLTASTVLLVVVAFKVQHEVQEPLPPLVQAVLVGAAVVVAVTSFVLPARFYGNLPSHVRSEVAETGRMGGFVSQGARFADPDRAAGKAIAVAQTPFILSMALSEAVSLLGFVVAFHGGPITVAGPLFAAGTLLAAIRFPTLARIVGPYERAHGATFPASTPASY